MTGLLHGAERFDALSAAAVVVYPSQDEIFGLVPFESLLCSTPVIVADDSGCGEVVATTGGGRLVPAGDVGALTVAVDETLVGLKARRRGATLAARKIRERLTTGPVCQAHE